MISYTALAAGPLAILIMLMGVAISLRRITGRGEGESFERLRRIHGNATEHVPIILIALFLAETLRAPPTLLLIAAITAITARLLHAGGFWIRRRHPLHTIGSSLTYTVEGGLGILVTVQAFS